MSGDFITTFPDNAVARGAQGVAGPTGATGPTGSGGLISLTVLTSGTSFTTGSGTNKIRLRMVGGGGGGGFAKATSGHPNSADGGSAGGYAEKIFTVSPSTSYTYAIGAGGSGGVVSGSVPATDGGNTTFTVSGVTVTAPGGPHGLSPALLPYPSMGSGGGVGSNPTNGDINVTGESGGPGFSFSPTNVAGGVGGITPFGSSQWNPSTGAAVAGPNAVGYGSGGSGACDGNNFGGANGGAGAPGIIIVEEYS